MTVMAQLYLANDDERSGDRATVALAGTLRESDGTPLDVTILDISTTGVRVVSPQVLPVGDTLRIGIAGIGVSQVQVVRRDGDQYGCAFVKPLSLNDLSAANGADTVVPGNFAVATPVGEAPQAVEEKLPMPARLAIILGSSVAIWAALLAAIL